MVFMLRAGFLWRSRGWLGHDSSTRRISKLGITGGGLHYTLHRDDPKVVQSLLEHGADPNARENVGETPLHVALQYWKSEVVAKGAAQGWRKFKRTDDVTWKRHYIVHRCSANPKTAPECCSGMVPSSKGMEDGRRNSNTSCIGARKEGDALCAQYRLRLLHVLLERGARPAARRRYRETPLHRASRCGGQEVAEVLLKYGRRSNRTDGGNGEPPLYLASEFGEPDVVRLLLEHGASVETEDKKGRTAYKIAFSERTPTMVQREDAGRLP
ncbi:ankyrin repeat-containing domain protein [Russula compacta]|nr:ankyrin repeat-containing domain protein [Russula compacta]